MTGQPPPDLIVSPRCPGCHELPMTVVSPAQAFCGNDTGCRVLVWDMTVDEVTFWAAVVTVPDPGAP